MRDRPNIASAPSAAPALAASARVQVGLPNATHAAINPSAPPTPLTAGTEFLAFISFPKTLAIGVRAFAIRRRYSAST